jgi:hypothetical protein
MTYPSSLILEFPAAIDVCAPVFPMGQVPVAVFQISHLATLATIACSTCSRQSFASER